MMMGDYDTASATFEKISGEVPAAFFPLARVQLLQGEFDGRRNL